MQSSPLAITFAGIPKYEIKSDKTEHIAMHKGAVLHKIE